MAQRKSGFGRRRSRGSGFISLGSLGLRLDQEQAQVLDKKDQSADGNCTEQQAGMSPTDGDDDMARAAAIVAAMDLADELSSDSEGGSGSFSGSTTADLDLDESDALHASASSLSTDDLEKEAISELCGKVCREYNDSRADGCLTNSVPRAYSVGYLNDLSDDDVAQANAAPPPSPSPVPFQRRKPSLIARLNDLSDDDDDYDENNDYASPSEALPPHQQVHEDADFPPTDDAQAGVIIGAPPFRRQRRRASFGALSASSLGTMSVADITIEEDLCEDLSSGDEEEDEDKEGNKTGDWVIEKAGDGSMDEAEKVRDQVTNNQNIGWEEKDDTCGRDKEEIKTLEYGIIGGIGIDCTSVKYSTQYNEVVSEYGADCSSLGDLAALSEFGEDFEHDGEMEVQTGYIDMEGNVNRDLAQGAKEQESMDPPEHAARRDNGDEMEDSEDEGDFILSFPSPEERAAMRRASQEGESSDIGGPKEENNAESCCEDDSDDRSLHFPTAEERATIRRMSQVTTQERESDEDSIGNGALNGNASAQTWSGWSAGTEDDSLGGMVKEMRAEVEMTPEKPLRKLFEGRKTKSEVSLWGRRQQKGADGGRGGGLGWFGFRGRDAKPRDSTRTTEDSGKGKARGSIDRRRRSSVGEDHRRRSSVGDRGEGQRNRANRHRPQKRPDSVPDEIKKIIMRNQRK
mmetsp:Transcript_49547/g.149328  ORF Transcript_49547/g.149328 Transcript_49547/m.149328 type:complete len:687 (-) Transcript_49547:989-3049(-)